jgi:hypothetical protein
MKMLQTSRGRRTPAGASMKVMFIPKGGMASEKGLGTLPRNRDRHLVLVIITGPMTAQSTNKATGK